MARRLLSDVPERLPFWRMSLISKHVLFSTFETLVLSAWGWVLQVIGSKGLTSISFRWIIVTGHLME